MTSKYYFLEKCQRFVFFFVLIKSKISSFKKGPYQYGGPFCTHNMRRHIPLCYSILSLVNMLPFLCNYNFFVSKCDIN